MWPKCKIFLLSLLLCVSFLAAQDATEEVEWSNESEMADNLIKSREYLVSWQVRRSIRKILQQMPCGWPQYNIPPLAPYHNDNLTLGMNNQILNAQSNFQPMHIIGLDEMEINNLLVVLTLGKVYFDFNFPRIAASGKFDFAWLLDLARREFEHDLARDLGVHSTIKGRGDLDFSLENLRINGTLRYSLPWIFGSAKVYDLKLTLSLEAAHSQLRGKINSIPITKFLNRKIEREIMKLLENYESLLSSLIAQSVQTHANNELRGKKIWQLIWWAVSSGMGKCPVNGVENTTASKESTAPEI